MKKSELMEITDKYNMDFIRDAITQEGCGVYRESEEPIPELDAIVAAGSNEMPVIGEEIGIPGHYIYRIFCPSSWIDLCGWKD